MNTTTHAKEQYAQAIAQCTVLADKLVDIIMAAHDNISPDYGHVGSANHLKAQLEAITEEHQSWLGDE